MRRYHAIAPPRRIQRAEFSRPARFRRLLRQSRKHVIRYGTEVVEQPDFVRDFARRCIDAGADVFATHGPHILMRIEIYHRKPIFYSLGNLIMQNDTLR
ncbi:MAG: CapA family protein, partial [Candidatus Binatia bacterium]